MAVLSLGRPETKEAGRRRLAMVLLGIAIAGASSGSGPVAHAARLKDIAHIEGVRANQLSGYSLVVGLDGTGDTQQTIFSFQTVANMLRRQGIDVEPRRIRIKNTAAVVVTALLPPFARSGQRIDVQVSSLGDAESLRGGTLLLAPLYGADGRVYAVAQGPVSIGGGFSAAAPGAAAVKSHPTVGYIPGGALVERAVPVNLGADGALLVRLRTPDFTTADRVAAAIQEDIGWGRAVALDAGTVRVALGAATREEAVSMATRIESLEVTPDSVARVVLNERTGTVIMGEHVRVAPVAIAHGSLSIQVKTEFGVSQPAPLSKGETVVVPDTTLEVQEGERQNLVVLRPGVSLGQLVTGLNALGVTPQDLIAVLQAIEAAGALQAELEVM